MANTLNLGLYKPSRNDAVEADVSLAQNFETIDVEVHGVKGRLTNVEAEMTTLGTSQTEASQKAQAALDTADGVNSRLIVVEDDVDSLKTTGLPSTTAKKVSGIINIAEYSVVGDGVTDDTTAITSAVADAYVEGYTLFWGNDNKTYLTTASIPDFHNIKHTGNAVIKRGTDLFYITPTSTDTNVIYTGYGSSSGNDGLSSSQPRSLAEVRDLLQNLGDKAAKGQWRIQFVAGTCTDTGLVFNNLPYFSKPLQIWGVWDGTNRLAVWDGTNSTAVYAFRADGVNNSLFVEFKDMKWTNWNKDTSNAGAIVTWQGVNVKTENNEFINCTIGFWGRGGYSRHYADIIDGSVNWGYCFQYSHTATVGASTYARNVIKNCTRGVFVGRTSVAHVDYTDFSNNTVNIQVHQKSRVASVNSVFSTWTDVCIWLQGDSLFENDGSTWDANSITDLTPIYRLDTGSAVPAVHIGSSPYRVAHYVPNAGYALTGTTVDTHLSAQTGFGSPLRIPKHLLYNNATLQFNIKCRLDVGGNNGTRTVTLTGAGTGVNYTIASLTIPTGSSGGGVGEVSFEITLRANGTGIYKAKYECANSSFNAVVFGTISTTVMDTIRDKTADLTLWRLYGVLANASDSMTLYSITTTMIG